MFGSFTQYVQRTTRSIFGTLTGTRRRRSEGPRGNEEGGEKPSPLKKRRLFVDSPTGLAGQQSTPISVSEALSSPSKSCEYPPSIDDNKNEEIAEKEISKSEFCANPLFLAPGDTIPEDGEIDQENGNTENNDAGLDKKNTDTKDNPTSDSVDDKKAVEAFANTDTKSATPPQFTNVDPKFEFVSKGPETLDNKSDALNKESTGAEGNAKVTSTITAKTELELAIKDETEKQEPCDENGEFAEERVQAPLNKISDADPPTKLKANTPLDKYFTGPIFKKNLRPPELELLELLTPASKAPPKEDTDKAKGKKGNFLAASDTSRIPSPLSDFQPSNRTTANAPSGVPHSTKSRAPSTKTTPKKSQSALKSTKNTGGSVKKAAGSVLEGKRNSGKGPLRSPRVGGVRKVSMSGQKTPVGRKKVGGGVAKVGSKTTATPSPLRRSSRIASTHMTPESDKKAIFTNPAARK